MATQFDNFKAVVTDSGFDNPEHRAESPGMFTLIDQVVENPDMLASVLTLATLVTAIGGPTALLTFVQLVEATMAAVERTAKEDAA